jgi:hypothetical protein
MSDYKINEQDINGVFNYLKIFHPEKATREYAREMLEYLKAGYHRLALTNPDALHELFEAFEKSKTS